MDLVRPAAGMGGRRRRGGAVLSVSIAAPAFPAHVLFDFDLLFPLVLVAALALGERFERGIRAWPLAVYAVVLTIVLVSAPTVEGAVDDRRQLAVLGLAARVSRR